jgi:trehalose 6-phosphate phosphatase
MLELASDLNLSVFFRRLARSRRPILMLDYDGTLAPFQADRLSAVPYPGVGRRLERILEGRTRLVLVTGRPVEEIRGLFSLSRPVEIWGSHGRERWRPDAGYSLASVDEETERGLTRAVDWIRRAGLAEHCERKPGCVALHRRSMDPEQADRLLRLALREWEELVERGRLELHHFDGGIELRSPGVTKGDAVRGILGDREPSSACAYLGDDLTDESAFEALHNGDLGVLVRPERRDTRARLWLRPPKELLGFLDRWAAAAAGGRPARPDTSKQSPSGVETC